MKKKLLTVMLLAASSAFAQRFSVGVGIGAPGYYPPAGVPGGLYNAPAPCGPGYLWIDGYYDVNGYWVNGYCAVPPYGDAYWVAPGFFGGRWAGGYWAHRGFDRDDFRFRGGDRGGFGFHGGDRGDFRSRGGFGNGFHSQGVAPNNFRGSVPNNFRGSAPNNFRPQGGPQNFHGGGGGGAQNFHGGGGHNGGGFSGHGGGHGGRR